MSLEVARVLPLDSYVDGQPMAQGCLLKVMSIFRIWLIFGPYAIDNKYGRYD